MSLIVETRLLKPVATAIVPVRNKSFNVAQFYNRKCLCVAKWFHNRFDLEALTPASPEHPYVALLLKTKANNRDICRELPKDHLSTLEDIAGFIDAQSNGEKGFLPTSSYANIFYVLDKKNDQVFSMRVRWLAGSRRWAIYGWIFDGRTCFSAGHRVLCPGNAAL